MSQTTTPITREEIIAELKQLSIIDREMTTQPNTLGLKTPNNKVTPLADALLSKVLAAYPVSEEAGGDWRRLVSTPQDWQDLIRRAHASVLAPIVLRVMMVDLWLHLVPKFMDSMSGLSNWAAAAPQPKVEERRRARPSAGGPEH